MKKLLVLLMVIIFYTTLFANPVLAGSAQYYRWEGIAIGLGAAILGSALINSAQPDQVTVVHETYYEPAPPRVYHEYCAPHRVWVPPVYEKVWNPGHYEYGRWVHGQYIMVERAPGYWTEKRVCR